MRDMSRLEIERFALEDANVFCVRLKGYNTVKDSLANAETLCRRMVEEAREGLIMDYRECQLAHTLAEFTRVAEVFAEHMPSGLRVAYVHAPENFMHAAVMTKALAKAGLTARAFSSWDAAESFARSA